MLRRLQLSQMLLQSVQHQLTLAHQLSLQQRQQAAQHHISMYISTDFVAPSIGQLLQAQQQQQHAHISQLRLLIISMQ